MREIDDRDYARAFDSSAVGILLLESDGSVLRANQRLCEMSGYSAVELEKLSFRDLAHPDEAQTAHDYFERMVRGELESVSLELRCMKKQGGFLWTNITSRLLRSAAGVPEFFVSVVHDISERREADQALRQRTADLSAANATLLSAARYKDEFLSSMSHELRTPLNGVLGLTDALRQQTYGELNPRQQRSLELIAESGQHLLHLINELLDLSKLEAGTLELELGVVAVDDVCGASLRAVREITKSRSQRISYARGDATLLVIADAQRLKQILSILLVNASKFTPENAELGLEVSLDLERETVDICVWDQGIGIDAQALQRLFKPFVQLDAGLSRKHGGVGLGLVLAYRLVELLSGSISVSSEPGKGSRFLVSLPWRQGKLATDPPRTATWHSPRVLVVEDSAVTSGDLKEQLEDLGARVWIHETLGGAFERVLEVEPQLLILDVFLPDGPGWTLLARLRADARTSELPVVISSAVEDRAKAAAMGASAYLEKPARATELAALLDQTLPGSVSGRALPVAPPSIPPAVRHARTTVLVADDNEINAAVVREYLESQGYRVEIASDGKQAVELARLLKPSLILMDVQMPGLDGIEATRQIRAFADEHSADVPIVAVTALALPGDRERCLSSGATDYQRKPLSLSRLMQTIERLTAQARPSSAKNRSP
ncbi:MAG TPA: response regulator [Polyangiaceae bacterium]|nr:response regulator [Polyangiaceae bacterium]